MKETVHKTTIYITITPLQKEALVVIKYQEHDGVHFTILDYQNGEWMEKVV